MSHGWTRIFCFVQRSRFGDQTTTATHSTVRGHADILTAMGVTPLGFCLYFSVTVSR